MRTANALLVKEVNRHLVRRRLMELRTATKQRLAKDTGLSQMTVGSIIAAFLETGEAAAGALLPSGGGRPSMEYGYNGAYAHVAVLYGYQRQGRTLICLRVFNLLGETVWGREAYLEEIDCASFEPLLDAAFDAAPAIRLLLFGLPGVEEDGKVVSNDYRKLEGERFMAHYRDRYAVEVGFVNDVNAAAFGYYKRVAALCPARSAVAGIYFPRRYDPGMGLILEGRIYAGKQNFAGEFGSLPLDISWPVLAYEDKAVLYDALSRLLAAVCCMIAPERMILYGDFFAPEDAAAVQAATERRLGGVFAVALETAVDFAADFEGGLQSIGLERVYAAVFGDAPSV